MMCLFFMTNLPWDSLLATGEKMCTEYRLTIQEAGKEQGLTSGLKVT